MCNKSIASSKQHISQMGFVVYVDVALTVSYGSEIMPYFAYIVLAAMRLFLSP